MPTKRKSDAETERYRKCAPGAVDCKVPPKGNANYAWVQHFIPHLAA